MVQSSWGPHKLTEDSALETLAEDRIPWDFFTSGPPTVLVRRNPESAQVIAQLSVAALAEDYSGDDFMGLPALRFKALPEKCAHHYDPKFNLSRFSVYEVPKFFRRLRFSTTAKFFVWSGATALNRLRDDARRRVREQRRN
jgi:hypothetical protein